MVKKILSLGVAFVMLVATFLSNNNYISFVVPSIGAISLFANIMFTRIKFLKRVPIGEYITTTVYTVIFFFIYTLMCMLMAYAFPNSKLFFNFNLTYLTYIPLKYFFHKLIFIGSITKD